MYNSLHYRMIFVSKDIKMSHSIIICNVLYRKKINEFVNQEQMSQSFRRR